MALNAIERALLVAARVYLADGQEERICYALSRACGLVSASMPSSRVKEVGEARRRLVKFIMGQIQRGGVQTFGLETWIADKLPGCGAQNDEERMLATRLAWIDWLLDEPWTEHNGGPQPLLPTEKVIVRLRNGIERSVRTADVVRWHNAATVPALYGEWATAYDTVAYKVIYEAPNAEQPEA